MSKLHWHYADWAPLDKPWQRLLRSIFYRFPNGCGKVVVRWCECIGILTRPIERWAYGWSDWRQLYDPKEGK